MIQLLRNISSLAVCPASTAQGDIAAISKAAIVWRDETILWVGAEANLPSEYQSLAPEAVHDAGGATVIPGLIDCHTHLAFGGWRAEEFEMRCRGAGYQEIAEAGGGIADTVRRTRQADPAELLGKARSCLDQMLRLGVTAVECKSGYGLTIRDEMKLLEVYRELASRGPQHIVATLLGAHIVPPEFRTNRDGYVKLLTEKLIPQVAERELAKFCDVFIEDGAFTPREAIAILDAAKRHGLRPKLHVDQLADGGGAALAAKVGAVCADHLEYANDDGIEAMARAGVVAVALPLASLYLRQPPMAARKFIAAGGMVAVATDFNPGSAPSCHLPLAMLLACTMNRMTPAEALKAATIVAARAMGMDKAVGSLEAGKQADFVLLDAPDVNHWLYHFRANAALATYIGGREAWRTPEPR